MLKWGGFDGIVAKMLEVYCHTHDGTNVSHPTAKGRKERIGLGGCDMQHGHDTGSSHLSQIRHVDGWRGQGPA